MNLFAIETLAIGDELLTGKIADTNSAFVGQCLFEKSLRLSRQNVVPDEKKAIQSTFKEIAQRAKVAICFGGLGPTSDDITAATVAEILGRPLVTDELSKDKMIAFLKARNRQVTEQTLKQVLVPQGTEVIPNGVGGFGLAPGFSFVFESCTFFFLPGVPNEMNQMFKNFVLPKVLALAPEQSEVVSRVWRCIGIVESEVQRLMVPIEKSLPAGMWLGYRTRFPENYLYLYSKKEKSPHSSQSLDFWTQKIETLLAPFCYGREEKDLEQWVFDLLKRKNKKLALAESCTGGLVIQRLTRVPGASDFIWGGYVTYQLDAKKKMLGVEFQKELDAVSMKSSEALALGALEKSVCDYALGISGYMGPSGGTSDTPVGTIFICVKDKKGGSAQERIQLPPRPRDVLQWGASSFALNCLRKFIE